MQILLYYGDEVNCMKDNRKQSFFAGAADGSYRFHHSRDERPNPRDYKPHYENGYEIYMFINGEGSYTIEGSRYELEPYSILLMNPNELHVLNISEQSPYERIVFGINESFLPPFMLNGVDFFRCFKFRKLGHGNQLKSETVRGAGLVQLFEKLQSLLERKTPENELVAKCVIVEILSAINQIYEADHPASHRSANHKVRAVLEHINANLDEQLNLDLLSEKFFVTKYHLCRIFKEETGFSINQYITYKRIHMADALMQEGNTPTQACFMSGFNCYSNFFKSYRKLTGKSPRKSKA
jgi:AraC-like DNA-binding protein